MSQHLKSSGYEVHSIIPSTINNTMEIQLSACATMDGRWILSPVAKFPYICPSRDSDNPRLLRNSFSSTSSNNNSNDQNDKKEPASVVVVLEYGLIEVIFLSLMFAAFISCQRLFARRDRRTDTGDGILYDPILMSDEMTLDYENYNNNRNSGNNGGGSTLLRDVGSRRGPAVELITQP